MPNSESYLIYLRKSRADMEAEQRGEGETLRRHERALLELAARLHLSITDIYREVASGETIAARPMMQRLLDEVEDGRWAGVLVMEVERLARGDTVDQGIVSQAFKYSGTKIVTPAKTYDPNNEYDEEYFEFGLFMSRREYKAINRRLQRGRVASIKEGKYPHSVAPFGYDRRKLAGEKGFTIVPNPEEAPVVQMIYELYTMGEAQENGQRERLGLHRIATELNRLGVRTKYGNLWSAAGVRDLIRNPVYIGKLWRRKRKSVAVRDGTSMLVRYQRDCSQTEIYQGLHEPLISEDTYALAQRYLSETPAIPVPQEKETQNPLCGLVLCGKCGKKMQRHKYFKRDGSAGLICPHSTCDNVGAALSLVENRIIEALREWLNVYELEWSESPVKASAALELRKRAAGALRVSLSALKKQQGNLHDLLERGIYDTDTFLERSRVLAGRLSEAEAQLEAAEKELSRAERQEQNRAQYLPRVKRLLDVYDVLPTASAKNALLKEVLDRVVYVKEPESRRTHEDLFTLELYPRLPRKPPEPS